MQHTHSSNVSVGFLTSNKSFRWLCHWAFLGALSVWEVDLSAPEIPHSMAQMISFSKTTELWVTLQIIWIVSLYLLEQYPANWVFLSTMGSVQSEVFGIIFVKCCWHVGRGKGKGLTALLLEQRWNKSFSLFCFCFLAKGCYNIHLQGDNVAGTFFSNKRYL